MRKLTILDTVEDIYRALDAKAYLSAFALALTVPDILSKVEYPKIRGTGDRYIKWMDEFFLTEEEKKARMENLDETDEVAAILNRIDGRFYYALRNAFLHSGNNWIKSLKDVKFRLSFDGGGSTVVWGYPEGPTWKRHVLSIYDFCMKICGITEYKIEKWKDSEVMQKRLEKTGINLFTLEVIDDDW